MARLFATGINLNKNELLNARIHNNATDPLSPVAGQIYFNTGEKVLKFYDGFNWIAGGSVEFGNTTSRPAASKAGTLYVDTQTKTLYVDNGTSWVQGTLSESDVQGLISDHNDLTTGVHGVTGDVVGTSDTQSLSNKTFQGPTYFQSGGGAGSNNNYLDVDNNSGKLNIHSGYALEIEANNDINITSDAGSIIFNYDGGAYIGSASANNQIATIGDLNSNSVVQSVTGTDHEIEVTNNGQGDVTVGLPDDVAVKTSLTVGESWVDEADYNGLFKVKKSYGSDAFKVDSSNNITVINSELEIQDGAGNALLNIYESGTGTARIVGTDDISIRSTNGDIILYPGNDDGGTGKAYVHWGNDATGSFPQHEITTAGNTQTFTNKTIGDVLTFNDGSNNSTIDVDGNNLYINANNNLQLGTANGNIIINPDGYTQANGTLKAGDLVTGWIYGNENNGNIDITDWNENSAIHIDGTTHNIELLPGNGGKAFYGSAATAGNEIAKISDLQSLSSGLSWKQAVNLLADTGQNFAVDNVGHSIDGHTAFTLADAGYRILLTGQTNASENGIYELYVDGSTLLGRRAADSDTDAELKGAAVFVMEGNTYAGTSWVQNNHYISSFVGQDWVQFSGQGTYIGSDSIYLDGRSINVVADGTRGLAIDGDGTYVKIGDGIQFVSGNVSISAGTGFDTTSGTLEFATGYGVRKLSADLTYSISTNSNLTYTVTHNWNTKDVTAQVYDNSAPYAQIETDVERSDNTVVIKFASAPSDGQYRVVIVG